MSEIDGAPEFFVFPPTVTVREGVTTHLTLFARSSGTVDLDVKLTATGFSGAELEPLHFTAPKGLPEASYLGCDWPSITLPLIPATGPGLSLEPYVLAINGTAQGLVVLRPERGPGKRKAKHLVMLPMATHQAYVSVGGGSFYDSKTAWKPRENSVSWLRPCNGYSEPWRDVYRWLTQQDKLIKAGDLDCCTSLDLHADETLLDGYAVLYLIGHDEYWSLEMLERIDRFVLAGGNVISMSGNTAFCRVRFDHQTIGGREHRFSLMSLYLPPTDDPLLANMTALPPADYAARLQGFLRSSPTSVFAATPTLRPQDQVLGVGFDRGYWGEYKRGAYRICPALLTDGAGRRHWALEGVKSTEFGSALFGHETDAVDFEPWGPDDRPVWRATGANGTPRNFTMLACADLRQSDTSIPGYATLGYYTRNGTVFTMSSDVWINCLSAVPEVATITRNVIRRLTPADGKRWTAWEEWEDIGHARDVRAMTASMDFLYVIQKVADNKPTVWWRPPVAADIDWQPLHSMAHNELSGIAVVGSRLFATMASKIGVFEPGGTAWTIFDCTGLDTEFTFKALTAIGRVLYALVQYPKKPPGAQLEVVWAAADKPVGKMLWHQPPPGCQPCKPDDGYDIIALAAQNSVLYGVTKAGKLVRTATRLALDTKTRWEVLGDAGGVSSLAALEGMLYGATPDHRLKRMDLHHFYIDPGARKP